MPKDTCIEGLTEPREIDWEISGGSGNGMVTVPFVEFAT